MATRRRRWPQACAGWRRAWARPARPGGATLGAGVEAVRLGRRRGGGRRRSPRRRPSWSRSRRRTAGDPALGATARRWRAAPARWVGYLSTTAVYGDRQGGWVDEKSPLAPVHRARALAGGGGGGVARDRAAGAGLPAGRDLRAGAQRARQAARGAGAAGGQAGPGLQPHPRRGHRARCSLASMARPDPGAGLQRRRRRAGAAAGRDRLRRRAPRAAGRRRRCRSRRRSSRRWRGASRASRSGCRTGGSARSWGSRSPSPTIAPASRASWRPAAEGPAQQPRRKSDPVRFPRWHSAGASSKEFGKVGIRRRMGAIEVGGCRKAACAREWPCWRWRRRRPWRPGTTAPAQEAAPPRPSLNLYGVTGLIDMPSAEAQPDAQVSASYSQFGNTSRRNFTFQLLPRMSGTLRYSTISDWGNDEDPDYNLFDRSLDLQFQLLKEKGWLPSVALGFRDVLGTGVYSAEYLVATKTVARGLHASPAASAGAGWPASAGWRTRSARSRTASAPARSTSAEGGNVDVRRDVPRREDGLLRRRRVADADRQADAEGRDLVGRLHPRAAGAEADLRAQVADQRRRRVPAGARASPWAATTCTARRWASTSWSPATRTSR